MIKYQRGDQVLILFMVFGYLVGSIPWGLIIGKVFFRKDIRQYGSGNLGGTNAGRVLGGYFGILVGVLDALKAFTVIGLVSYYDKDMAIIAGAMVAVGHCYPIFANFKGGKAVATAFGLLFGIGLFINNNFIIFISSFSMFVFLVLTVKIVSLSSMIAMGIALIISLFQSDITITLTILALTIFIIYRHRANIKRIINKTESKVYLIKRK